MKKLRILTANIALGMPASGTILGNVRALYMFHGWKVLLFILSGNRFEKLFDYSSKPRAGRLEYLYVRSDLSKTVKMIRTTNADIVILNELIHQIHRTPIESALKALGYQYFSWGISRHHADASVSTLIASKLPAEGDMRGLCVPEAKQMGGGAGAACLRLRGQPITVVGCHLSIGMPRMFEQQIAALVEFSEQEKHAERDTILAGDFNHEDEEIQRTSNFASLRLKTPTKQRTCPVSLPHIFRIACDQIYVPRSWQLEETDYLLFDSDHLAVCATVLCVPEDGLY